MAQVKKKGRAKAVPARRRTPPLNAAELKAIKAALRRHLAPGGLLLRQEWPAVRVLELVKSVTGKEFAHGWDSTNMLRSIGVAFAHRWMGSLTPTDVAAIKRSLSASIRADGTLDPAKWPIKAVKALIEKKTGVVWDGTAQARGLLRHLGMHYPRGRRSILERLPPKALARIERVLRKSADQDGVLDRSEWSLTAVQQMIDRHSGETPRSTIQARTVLKALNLKIPPGRVPGDGKAYVVALPQLAPDESARLRRFIKPYVMLRKRWPRVLVLDKRHLSIKEVQQFISAKLGIELRIAMVMPLLKQEFGIENRTVGRPPVKRDAA